MAASSDLPSAVQAVPYAEMMRSYLRGELDPETFADVYVGRYLADPTRWDDEIFLVLDRVMAYADDLEMDPAAQADDESTVAEEQLRGVVEDAVARLADLGVAPAS